MTSAHEAAAGFSAMAQTYDESAIANPVVAWMRRLIRHLVESRVESGKAILEIGAGSGVDAAYFASKGYRVHATDVAPGMLAAIAHKAAQPEMGGRLTASALSFDQLEHVDGRPYDVLFSNLGGLNCTGDLEAVTRGLKAVLRPGGVIVWVVMPPVCPWEMAQALRGHISTAKRRFSKGGTLANVGGERVRTWYHSPSKLAAALGPAFRVEGLRSFCVFTPPSYLGGFVERHGRMGRALMRMDDTVGGQWPFNRCGDFYALVARYEPET
jgi:ubiquinone/menaquinone biosynthesis C-methylase UbiE